jgi:SARP family transcriptional regulator, regulator of embCAB operon
MHRFQLLTTVSVRDDSGQEWPVVNAKTRAVFAALVSEPNTFVPYDQLIDALWESPPDSAIANLRNYKLRLSRLLGLAGLGRRLESRRGGAYRIALQANEVDAHAFTALARAGGAALRRGDPQIAAILTYEALDLCRGPIRRSELPSTLVFTSFYDGLEERRRLALEDYHAARIMMRDTGPILPDARAHAITHQTRERAWGQLMQALYFAGDPIGAEGLFVRARTAMLDHAGAEPTAALRDLQRALLNRDDHAVGAWRLGC